MLSTSATERGRPANCIDHVSGDRNPRGSRIGMETFADAPTASAFNPLDQGVTSDTFRGMKTISIKELHAATGKWVRAAKKTPIIVTDRGEQVAELRPLANLPAVKFPKRNWSAMPASTLDSTDLISADRDGR